ncbi:MAG: lytic transglycosylase domain-containing protein [Proteobacteria bacterium]|nr:lytic transglycosylase domain-containing protein [Pseudomonadota bacterium]
MGARVCLILMGFFVAGEVSAQGCATRLKEAFTYRSLKSAHALFEDGHCALEKKLITWHYMREGSREPSFEDYTRFAKHHDTWPWMFRVRKYAESRLSPQTPSSHVLAWFEDNPVKTLDGALALLDIVSKSSEAKAKAHAREIWKEVSLTPEETKTFMTRYGRFLGTQDHKARVRAFLQREDITPAQALVSYVDPKTRVLFEACAALIQGDKKALALYEKAKVHAKDDMDLRLAYLIWLRKNKTLEGATFLTRNPRLASYAPTLVWKQAHILLRRALEKGDRKTALALANMGHATSGEDYAQAQFLKGFFTLDKDPAAAFAIFEKTAASMKSAISKARFAYWAGRALEAQGSEKAHTWFAKASRYPSTYYGQLAAKKLGKTLDAPEPLNVAPELLEKVRKDERFQAARTLYKAGRERDGTEFLFMMVKNASSQKEREAIVKVAAQLSPTQTVGLAKEAATKGEMYCTEAYPVLGNLHARAMEEVDPALLHAVIRKESAFNSRTVSSAGAVGLTQMLPSTARDVAKKMGVSYSQDMLLNDDVYNVQLGARYLKSRLEAFDDNPYLALVAYNAGIKFANEWVQGFGDPRKDVDPTVWSELIPFGETRNYIHRVLEARHVYALGPVQEARINGSHTAHTPRKKASSVPDAKGDKKSRASK